MILHNISKFVKHWLFNLSLVGSLFHKYVAKELKAVLPNSVETADVFKVIHVCNLVFVFVTQVDIKADIYGGSFKISAM